MTKTEIIENMANDAGITKTEAQTCLESFIDDVTQALKKKRWQGHLRGDDAVLDGTLAVTDSIHRAIIPATHLAWTVA